ncbi:uncharacterized protein I303_101402 [Kwoniella dejecticola CBS 10117]|uniref:SGS-domain-containing protein n=1 Tax=Kwoniella dejecticola CBS 10117 TaxID=1296121 RepID=A0A1A6AHN5_9TREE|nr:uncharacterized protein I303_01411 [Kwoniella dejecticola CBS 10117]OBR89582.1 hypothetical protein I303_01411 [Kwoniella dejecticola CBS 10117]
MSLNTVTSDSALPTPRHDFYQDATYLTLSVYLKGYASEGVKENVQVESDTRKIIVKLPQLPSSSSSTSASAEARVIAFEPLFDGIVPKQSTSRVLSTKIEIKVMKSNPANWPSILSTSPHTTAIPNASSSTSAQSAQVLSPASAPAGPATSTSTSTLTGLPKAEPAAPDNRKQTKPQTQRKNWDKLLEDELDDNEDSKDPNAGGDAALQKFFSKIYGNADDDTKRAMIKSFTESGGTTLSTDWSNIGKERTPVRPPDGMEEKKM